jgi:hypothetical protein
VHDLNLLAGAPKQDVQRPVTFDVVEFGRCHDAIDIEFRLDPGSVARRPA